MARLERLQTACDAQRQRAEAAEAAAAEQEAATVEARQQGDRAAQRALAQVCHVPAMSDTRCQARMHVQLSTLMLRVHTTRRPWPPLPCAFWIHSALTWHG